VQFVEALICTEPGKLELVQRASPTLPTGSILVRPRRVGICGTDYHIFQGKHPFLQYPRVMGHELAVEVIDAPESAVFSAGDICVVNPYISCGNCIACRGGKPNCCVDISVLGVHRDGGLTGLLCVPAANLIQAPGLSADQCAAVEFLAIGAHAVKRGQVAKGDRVLVVGAGPIGLGAALFARLAGGQVAVLDQNAERARAAQDIIGAAIIPGSGDVLEAVRDYSGGTGFDIVFDATGNRTAMERGFDFVTHGGRYVLVSVVKEPITFSDPDFHRKELTLYGSRNATSDDFRQVIAAIRSGDAPVDRLITHRTTLADAAHAIPLWATAKSGLIKALVEIDG
jgi:2-desacetyl-2-hydroxyethyl bacteriochlorophyllide A dehydrogenase